MLSAWCLGILNSHRRFFLSYAAPVVWNVAIIVAVLVGRRPTVTAARLDGAGGVGRGRRAACSSSWSSCPLVLRLLGGADLSLARGDLHVARSGPQLRPASSLSRGVVQLSAFIDAMIASLLPTGAVAALANAQLLYPCR